MVEPEPEPERGAGAVEPPWWRTPKGRSTKRQPLSRDAIVDAAVRILDAEGVAGLTLRRLGQELDTGAATLYWHISGKEELGELVYDRIMGEVVLPPVDPEHWQDQLKDLGRQCYRVMLSHNDAVHLSLGRMGVGPNMLGVMEWLLALLRGAGIPDAMAAYFGDLLGRYLDASVLEVRMAPVGEDPDDPGAWWAMVHRYFAELPVDRYPNLVATNAVMFGSDGDERFELGLDLLVRGLEAYLEDET